MSVLNRPSDGLLSVLIALRSTLLAFGPLSADRLIALTAPPSAVGAGDMARKTLLRWTQLGMFIDAGESIALAPTLHSVPPHDLDGLRRALLRLVLSHNNNPGFDQPTVDASNERPLSSDFTRAACWVLAQDPYSLEATHASIEALQNVQRVTPVPFVNDTRWAGFIEWALFLGLAWRAPRLVVDPYFAVASALPDVFTSERTVPADAFLARVAAVLPIVDRGRYRSHVDATIGVPARPLGDNDVSMTLSAALLHLEASGVIRLETRSDAPTRSLLGRRGKALRQISHVTLMDPA